MSGSVGKVGEVLRRNGVSGQRLPDLDLVLADGSRKALYRFLEDGRWVRLQAAPDKETTWDAEWIKSANLAPAPMKGCSLTSGRSSCARTAI